MGVEKLADALAVDGGNGDGRVHRLEHADRALVGDRKRLTALFLLRDVAQRHKPPGLALAGVERLQGQDFGRANEVRAVVAQGRELGAHDVAHVALFVFLALAVLLQVVLEVEDRLLAPRKGVRRRHAEHVARLVAKERVEGAVGIENFAQAIRDHDAVENRLAHRLLHDHARAKRLLGFELPVLVDQHAQHGKNEKTAKEHDAEHELGVAVDRIHARVDGEKPHRFGQGRQGRRDADVVAWRHVLGLGGAAHVRDGREFLSLDQKRELVAAAQVFRDVAQHRGDRNARDVKAPVAHGHHQVGEENAVFASRIGRGEDRGLEPVGAFKRLQGPGADKLRERMRA